MLSRPMNNSAQDMSDKFSVKELIEFERFCRDNALWDEMKKCYAPDATVDISWYQGSGYGFVDASGKTSIAATHKIYNTLIWLNDDKAFALTMATVEIRRPLDGATVSIFTDTKLCYRLVKTAGIWHITNFASIYEKDSIVPVYPNKDIHIDVSELCGYRSSYAGMCYMNYLDGRPSNEDLPGIDRPKLVEELYKDAGKWLKE